ncbi:GDSL-type esterase/lipase family protein [Fodinicola feengrottensis]|uniref:SGNH/GDSL hydrolase family protein n=1 Tax=Fodinicola feengrottensis TaxID=435914 RepID=A0ABN2IXZ6_9ACTN|nr:GDSL-type esterase/lipase family protein [Fodinicola feengrottensis]
MITTPIEAGMLRGALEVERTDVGLLPHRLPTAARRQFPDGYLARMEAMPSGVRLPFRTEATVVELDVRPTKAIVEGFPAGPDGVYDLLVDGRLTSRTSVSGGSVQTVDMTTFSHVTTPGPAGTARFAPLPAGIKDVEIWLPHNEITEVIALRTNAPVLAAADRDQRVWLHHGSSISHGSGADGPSETWPALAAANAHVDLVNLGFGGNAMLDPFTARALRDTAADLISVKIGINLTNADLMRVRAFGPAVHGFLDTVREGHPTTPLLVVSPLFCPIHEDTPGPGAADIKDGQVRFRATGDPSDPSRLTLNIIRAQLDRVAEQREDANLQFLDGRELYGDADYAELPLPDELHPSVDGHRRIAERFTKLAFDGPFARATG